MIISRDMVKLAITLATPTAEVILDREKVPFVDGFVSVPGVTGEIEFSIGESEDLEEGGFFSIALKKLELAQRIGSDTREIVTLAPWLLEGGEYLYPGCVVHEGIFVTVSGASGDADEAIARVVLACLVMLALQETSRRIDAGEMQI